MLLRKLSRFNLELQAKLHKAGYKQLSNDVRAY